MHVSFLALLLAIPGAQGPAPLRSAQWTPTLDPDAVYFDLPGDGALWARGHDYKARFDRQGATFFPGLGPRATRHWPVTFEVAAVHVGGEPLAFTRDVEPGREGDLVHYPRGTFVEQYVMSGREMEQRFHFEQRPAGCGDLVVEVAAETDLDPRQGLAPQAGVDFDGELGGVRYGRALAFDADGDQVAVPVSYQAGRIHLTVPAAFVESATWPLTIDPPVSTLTIAADGQAHLFPDVAYDHGSGRYLVVWQRLFSGNDFDVWSEQRNSLGNAVSGSGSWIDLSSASWTLPRVASNGAATQYLVVAQRGSSPGVEIWGRTRESESTTMSPQFRVSDAIPGLDQLEPVVGGDPTLGPGSAYCVAWEFRINATRSDVYSQLVRADGSFPLAQQRLVVGEGRNRRLAISRSNGGGPRAGRAWSVVWEHDEGLDVDVWAAQVGWNGPVVRAHFPVAGSNDDEERPSVASPLESNADQRPFLVVWERGPSAGGARDVMGRMFAPNGATEFNISNAATLDPSKDHHGASVESNGSSFLVAFVEENASTEGDLFAAILQHEPATFPGLAIAEAYQAWDTGPEDVARPRLTSMRSGGGTTPLFFGVWNRPFGLLGGDVAGGGYLSPGLGITFCNSLPNSSGMVGRLALEGSVGIAREELILRASSCPPNKNGFFFFFGPNRINVPFGNGRRCVGGQIRRILPVANTDAQGNAVRLFDFDASYAAALVPGSMTFQYWFRDVVGARFNLTAGLTVHFLP